MPDMPQGDYAKRGQESSRRRERRAETASPAGSDMSNLGLKESLS